MSVVAYKDGIVASDHQITIGGRAAFSGEKYFRNNDEMFCMVGITTKMAQFRYGGDIYQDGNEDEIDVMCIRDGEIWIVTGGNITEWQGFKLDEEYWALGHGGDYAMAGMRCGLSAVEAVELACIYDVYCWCNDGASWEEV